MKLFLYLKHFPPDSKDLNKGEGTRKAIHGLASGLAACGTDVTVICEGAQDSFTTSSEGYKIACFAHKNLEPCFSVSPALQDYMKQQGRDSLVILNGIFHRSVYALSRFLEQQSIAYIVAPHDPYHPSIFQKNTHLKVPYWLLFERRLLNQAKAIQVLDLRHSEWLSRLWINKPVLEVPNGFSPTDIHLDTSLSWSQDGRPRLFFLGRLDTHNKGLDILLDAFATIIKTSDAHLTLQGPDWGDRPSLEQQVAQLSLTNQVTFLEPDYQASPSSLIANYDIFCVPSRFEGFSLSALEAMLAGRVLLISEIAGIAPHVLASGCGVVVEPKAEEIAAGYQELLQRRSQWKEMGLRGRQYALEKLDWQRIAANALDQYQNLVGKE